MNETNQTHDVAAYIWPAYTGDEPRTRMFWPEGDGEWESVRKATPRFPGHTWPRRPAWGYCNEADPRVMEMQIDAAADHGVNVFIYDWYWYDGRPFLEQCLNNGYLQARNNDRVKFYLMWANHDVTHLWDKRLSHVNNNVIWRAALDRREFEKIGRRWIEKYFAHPSYYTIDGKPVLMIFQYGTFVDGLGGVEPAADAVAWLKEESRKAGFPGLHLQLSMRHLPDTTGVGGGRDRMADEDLVRIGFDSLSNYQFVCFVKDVDRDYDAVVDDAVREWERLDHGTTLPYFPHVSIGWDNNPRFREYNPPMTRNSSPERFEKAITRAKCYADRHPDQPPLITINSWNEWTEGSYLQPDDLHGYGYLKAVKKVFKGD